MRESIRSTFLRTSSGEEVEVREAVAVSRRVVFMEEESFSTAKWAALKFLRRSSKGRRRRGWSWGY